MTTRRSTTADIDRRMGDLEHCVHDLRSHVETEIAGVKHHVDTRMGDVSSRLDSVSNDLSGARHNEELRSTMLVSVKGVIDGMREDMTQMKQSSVDRASQVEGLSAKIGDLTSEIQWIRDNQTIRKFTISIIVAIATALGTVGFKLIEKLLLLYVGG